LLKACKRLTVASISSAFALSDARSGGRLFARRDQGHVLGGRQNEHRELAFGWVLHYATGLAFAALLVAIVGMHWTREPTLAPAIVVGLATVAAPWLLMQPAMGAGIASSKTPSPGAWSKA
jgi:hypothetical protein